MALVKRILLIFSLIATFGTIQITAQEELNGLNLTDGEKAWLADHKTIIAGGDPYYPPFEFIDINGNHRGMSVDYLKLIEERLGITISLKRTENWSQTLTAAKAGQLDMIMTIVNIPERRSYLNFTQPYIGFPVVLVTRKDFPDISGMRDLEGKTLALVESYYYVDEIIRKNPNTEKIFVDTPLEGLRTVASGRADAIPINLAIASYLFQEHSLLNLHVAANAEVELSNLSIGVRKDWPELVSILNKTLASLTQEEHQEIRTRWIGAIELPDPIAPLELTDAENRWLQNHKPLRLGVDPAYPPFEFIDENGLYSGMSFDYMKLISERLDTTLEIQYGLTWSQVLEGARYKSIDVLPVVTATPERREYLDFTAPYISVPIILVTRTDYPEVSRLTDFNGKTLAMVKGYYYSSTIITGYPEITSYQVDTPLEGLKSVAVGDADGMLINLGVAVFLMQKYNLANLRYAADSGLETAALSIGVRKDWPELTSIFNKALASFSQDDHHRIRAKWIGTIDTAIGKMEESAVPSRTILITVLQIGVVFVFVVALLVLLLWLLRRSSKDPLSYGFGSGRFFNLRIIGVGLMIAVVIVTAIFTLNNIKNKMETERRINMETTLHASNSGLNHWINTKLIYLKQFASEATLEELSQILTDRLAQEDPSAILRAQTEFQELIGKRIMPPGTVEYFLLSKNLTIVTEADETTQAIVSGMLREYTPFLDEALSGKSFFIPPPTAQRRRRPTSFSSPP